MILTNRTNFITFVDDSGETIKAIQITRGEQVDYNLFQTEILCAAHNWIEHIERSAPAMVSQNERLLIEAIRHLTHPEE